MRFAYDPLRLKSSLHSVDGTAAKYNEQTLSTNLVAYRAGSTTVVMCSPTSPFFSWLPFDRSCLLPCARHHQYL